MKYIDAEQLITKIEKRQEERQDKRDSASWENEYWPESDFCTRDKEDESIITIIESLQQEQMEIEKEAEISPSMISNFGSCAFNLSITFTQDEMNKMNIAPFFTKKVNVIIKDVE